MLLSVFDSSICVYDFALHETYLGKVDDENAINQLFALPEVIGKENVADAKGGRALSTVHLSNELVIPKILNFNSSLLGSWILNKMLESAYLLGLDKKRNVRQFKYHRTWVNRMYGNCNAVAHRHAGEGWVIPHLVAIYYTQVPEGSADLIFIDEKNLDVMRGGHFYEYPESKRYLIKSKAGRLVCHDAQIFHATSTHQSDIPRTCIIIEIGFPPLS